MTIRKLSSAMPMRILIPLLIGVAGGVVLAILTLYQSHKAAAEVEEEARRDLNSIMSSLQGSVNYVSRRNDMGGVQTMLTNEGAHDDVKYLALVDGSGVIVVASRAAANGLPLHSAIPELVHVFTICRSGRMADRNTLSFDKAHLLGCYPVSLLNRAAPGGLQAGYLLVSYDFSHRKISSAQSVTRLAVLLWSLFAAGFLLLMLLVRHALARRRIGMLLSATEKLAGGNLAARVGLKGSDELATISNAFDHMADQLQATTEAVESSHRQLEAKVEERTAELAKTNKILEREIAVRIQAEQAARRDGDWLRSLVQTSQDAVISIDHQGQIVLFNPAAERIFGYTAHEAVGRKMSLLMAEPDTWEHELYIADSEQVRKAPGTEQTRLFMAKRKTGEQFPIEVSLTEVAADQNVPYAAFIRDVSEKTRLQAQLVESERLAAIGTTAAKIGHEIANPLNGMYLTVQLLEQRLAKEFAGSDGQIAANIKKVRDEIGRLNQLVQQFRALARREQFEFQSLSVADLIRDVIALQQPLFASQGIEIEERLEPDLLPISADPDKLKQAILNLLKNAVEAMPNGGLGLVIVRQILTAHHGAISYSSDIGEGTKFTLSLPRA